jgi:hypothetical protein
MALEGVSGDGLDRTSEGPEERASIEGPRSGEGATSGVGGPASSTGAEETTLSVAGATKTGASIIARFVDKEGPEGMEWNVIEASDQLINGLKQWSQLYPKTISHRELRRVT